MIKEQVERLSALTEEDWCRYAFGREPLSDRLTAEQRLEYFRKAAECGAALAGDLKERLGNLPISEYAEKEGLSVSFDDTGLDADDAVFAVFRYPDHASVSLSNAEATDRLIAENDFSAVVGGVRTKDLLLAHELFHFYENRLPDLYIHRKHVILFRIGRLEHRSRILCLSEIAAMSFAGALTGLACSPYLYDVLMLYARNPQRARRQYEIMIRLTGG